MNLSKIQFDRFDVEKQLLLMTVAGSHSYGMDVLGSDYDYKGVLVLPKDEVLSPFKNFAQTQWHDKEQNEEGIVYELRKFVKLLTDCNPNIIEALFVKSEHIKVCRHGGQLLIDERDLFLSQKAAQTFVGYANSQLKRIKVHRRWTQEPPTKDGNRNDYKNYMTWKKTRNPSRAELENKLGFDPKNASHLVRLLRMGEEILTEGTVRVFRPDHKELLAIRRGAWSYDEIVGWAEAKKKEVFAIVDEGKAVVPKRPDQEKIEKLTLKIFDYHWNN